MTSLRVQYFAPRDCYRKSIGKHRGRDGQLRERVWYFVGVSEDQAIARAAALKAQWRSFKRDGITEWPADFQPPWTEDGEATRTDQSAPALAELAEFREVEIGQLTLNDALKLYKADLEGQAKATLISHARVRNAEYFARKGTEVLGSSSLLSAIDRSQLVEMVRHFRSRPNTSKGRAMSEETARCYVANCGTFFRWLAKQDAIGWHKPLNFDDIWAVGKLKPKSEKERKAKYLAERGVDRKRVRLFSAADLRPLYVAADDATKAWILLGLNCAFQNIDVSDLRVYEIHEGKPASIIRDREKTGVEGRWALWPETLEAIRTAQVKSNEHERVFLTPKGNPLVSREHRSDFVAAKWSELRKATNHEAALSFKHLRKTSLDTLFQMTGSMELQETHAAHREVAPMAKHYVDRLWTDLAAAQLKMRSAFATLWSGQGREAQPVRKGRSVPTQAP